MRKEFLIRLVVTWLVVMALGIGLSYVDWGTGEFIDNLGFNLTQLFKHWLREAQAEGQEMTYWLGYAFTCLIIAFLFSLPALKTSPQKPHDG